MRAVARPGLGGSGRWVWGLSGLVTAAVLGVPLAHLIIGVGDTQNADARPQHVVTRTETVPQPVTSLVVDSYGGQVQVASGPVSRVQVTETIMYDSGNRPPAVMQSVSGGRLVLSDPACDDSGCTVDFRMTVPLGVTATVSTGGGPVTVSGTAGANLDSGGGSARATQIGGPLTVVTGGGLLVLRRVAGPLHAETGGGTLGIATDPAARPALTVSSGGGALRIEPAPRLWRPGLSA
ncbi:MAG TPA: hypothetical protein VGL33_05680 [Streptosporangiaceae bacterium]|jgi:hypothetical protein